MTETGIIEYVRQLVEAGKWPEARMTLNDELCIINNAEDIKQLIEAAGSAFMLVFDIHQYPEYVWDISDKDGTIHLVNASTEHPIELICKPEDVYKFVRFV